MEFQYTLSKLAEKIGAEIVGDVECQIVSLSSLQHAKAGDLAFLGADKRYFKYLKDTKASAVLLTKDKLSDCPTTALVVDDPQLAFAQIARCFTEQSVFKPGIHPTAIIGADCNIDSSAYIGPYSVMADRVCVSAGAVVEAHCVLQEAVNIGRNCHLYSHVTCYSGVSLGDNSVVHSGAVIGADGFGLIQADGMWEKVPQLGSVTVGSDVEIGANTTIDRGALEDTVIGCGVKIDNQVQIAHNVVVGDHTAIAGCVGIAGSTTIGKHCIIGGGVAINGHIDITDHVILAAMSAVSTSIKEAGVYAGQPSLPRQKWQRNIVHYRNLDSIVKRVRQLEKKHD